MRPNTFIGCSFQRTEQQRKICPESSLYNFTLSIGEPVRLCSVDLMSITKLSCRSSHCTHSGLTATQLLCLPTAKTTTEPLRNTDLHVWTFWNAGFEIATSCYLLFEVDSLSFHGETFWLATSPSPWDVLVLACKGDQNPNLPLFLIISISHIPHTSVYLHTILL